MTPATDLGSVSFFVPGMPGTKGSARGFVVTPKGGGKPRAVITNDAGDKAKAWAAVVALAAREAMAGRPPFAGPVEVGVTFFLPRPKAHYGKRGELKASAPTYPTGRPDGDKMLRCTWDALTGICYADDAQIAQWPGSKVYIHPGQYVGASICVRQLESVAVSAVL